MIKIEKYQTSDGKEFTDEKSAKFHEHEMDFFDLMGFEEDRKKWERERFESMGRSYSCELFQSSASIFARVVKNKEAIIRLLNKVDAKDC